jgi:hypothetical protein
VFLFLYKKNHFDGLIDPAGVRDESEWGAALHVRMAARFFLAQGPRLPLSWYRYYSKSITALYSFYSFLNL